MTRTSDAADALEVLLNDRRVGVITALGGDQSIFSFDDAYADDPDPRDQAETAWAVATRAA